MSAPGSQLFFNVSSNPVLGMRTVRRGEGEPEISVVGSLHGDEPAGAKAIERILSRDIAFLKPVQFIVANEAALEEDVRYLDTDLNRSFPGSRDSDSREERIAAELLETVEGTVVLDIHTTQSHPEPFATIKRIDQDVIDLVRGAGVERAVHFPQDNGTMTEYIDRALVVEAGRQGTEEAVDNAVRVITNFLAYVGAIEGECTLSKPEIFQYYETVDGDWEFRAENFERVEEGELYAVRDGEELRAEEAFYPVLMSTNGYEGKLGYKARKVDG